MKPLARVIGALICLFITQTLSSQTSEYTNFADNAFQNLDKGPITTGILYDRVCALANIHGFNPLTDTVSAELLEQGHFEIYNAAYNQSVFLKPDDLTYIRDVENYQQRIPVCVLDYRFNWMDTLAITQNLFSLQNGLLYDVPGRPRSPYKESRIQMASPLYQQIAPGALTFSFAYYLALNNQGLSVQQIGLSFPGVGSATLFPGSTASLTFSSTGDYVGTVTVTYTNGTSFSNKCIITTTTPNVGGGSGARLTETNDPPCWSRIIYSTQLFQGYDETQAYRGRQEVNFYYRLDDPSISCYNSEQQLKKPVILIDGFDPTDRRDAFNIYNHWLNYTSGGEVKNLAQELRSLGHDVIIVNIPQYIEGTVNIPIGPGTVLSFPRLVRGGGDYIERNALTLVEVINYVNSHMVDPVNEHIVVVGPSMGGQISRYALRWMEKNNLNHNCRTWVSMDSPHLGAIIPIGVQDLVAGLAKLSKKGKEMLNSQINVPAAKQQLIHHYLSGSETPVGAPGFFNRYYDALNNDIGWPQIPRRVAVNSGAHNGLQQQGAPCGDAFWVKIRPRKWVQVLFFPTAGARVEATVRLAPSSSPNRCQVLDLGLNTLIGTFPLTGYASHAGAFNQSLELLPGGWYPGFRELYDGVDAGRLDFAIKVEKALYVPNHSFVPTASALAYGKGPTPNPSRRWDDDVTNLNLGTSCGLGEIPFVTYQGPTNFNTQHDLLFEAQAQFLKDEITGNIATIPGLSISGPGLVCTNRPYIFSVNMPNGGSVTWNVTGASVTLTPLGTNSVQVMPNGTPTTGGYILVATVTANCITTSIQRGIAFNTMGVTYTCSQVGNGTCNIFVPRCASQYFTERAYTIPNKFPDVPTWHWFVSGGTFRGGLTSKYNPAFISEEYVTPNAGTSSCILSIRPVSECGIENTFEPFKYQIINTGGSCFASFTLSPNPASSSVMVATNDNVSVTASKQADRNITTIKIYNEHGLLKKQKSFGKVKTAFMSVSDLPNGIYFMEIISGDHKERQKLLVQH